MNKSLLFASVWKHHFHSASRHGLASLRPVDTAPPSPRGFPDIQAFQQKALIPKKPLFFQKDAGSPTVYLPALSKWFNKAPSSGPSIPISPSLIENFQEWPFPYELIRSSRKEDSVALFRNSLMSSSEMTDQIMAGILQSAVTEGSDKRFFQVYSPLRLLIKALEYNASRDPDVTDPLQLYIAQSALPDLPQPLRDDLPAPEFVQRAGKGDIYSSSIWLGTEPTYTPLHRDPNPNLFCQLYSQKVVRLVPPSVGDRLFFEVQVQIRQRGNSRIRTTDMMEGEERKVLHDAVWESESLPDDMFEVKLDAGDALFIPEGWWHSVKSVKSDGGLNGSVNWWFR
ncbi:hypothetical protein QQS21_010048 [Conoideocrella luteorostrata]|uniref:JmjC domain-containing protein n=1 Tax=Conoideocrella luteorostrata TaxID=1105319 RepID=A0AAJ0CFY0_9HYPO|nr:hypothetical protein QQS21_010048 [Conoideocrella luteorostrata]